MITGTYPDIEAIALLGLSEELLAVLEISGVVCYDLEPESGTIIVNLAADITPESAVDALNAAYAIIDSVNRWAGKQVERGVSVN